MERVKIEALKKLIDEHPLKEIRGRFKVNIPFNEWDWGSGLNKFLEENKPWLVLVTENNQLLGRLELASSMFDEQNNELSEIYVLPFLEGNMALKVSPAWPDWYQGGEFVIFVNFN